jgi:hypothetical protein
MRSFNGTGTRLWAIRAATQNLEKTGVFAEAIKD